MLRVSLAQGLGHGFIASIAAFMDMGFRVRVLVSVFANLYGVHGKQMGSPKLPVTVSLWVSLEIPTRRTSISIHFFHLMTNMLSIVPYWFVGFKGHVNHY